jgi:amino-acid N-acetyltransferase
MELNYETVKDAETFEAFRSLLKASNLPADDLDYERDLLIGYYEDGQLVGTGGLEVHDGYGLLRSLSVKFGIRGKAVGTTITQYLLEKGRENNLKGIYLLTETAKGFFEKKGFKEVSRDTVPEPVKRSSEFSNVCPTSATVMVYTL